MYEDYIKKNYKAYYTWQGWQIQKTNENGKHLYVSKVYRGKYTFMLDYLYAKSFKKLETAIKHIEKLIDQEANT